MALRAVSTRWNYTVDGGDAGSVEYENFNAAAATVTIHGVVSTQQGGAVGGDQGLALHRGQEGESGNLHHHAGGGQGRRLLNYVRVYTTSDPESGTHPSAAREFDLAHQLVEELKALGVEDARVDEHSYVYGSLPATPGCEDKPALGLIAHMDTAPDASGENVNPILHENYDGSDVTKHPVFIIPSFPLFDNLFCTQDNKNTKIQ